MSAAQQGRHGLGLGEPEQGSTPAPACADCGTPTGLALINWAEGTAVPLCQRCIIARCAPAHPHVVEWETEVTEACNAEPVDVDERWL
jgi:hypothetical protein